MRPGPKASDWVGNTVSRPVKIGDRATSSAPSLAGLPHKEKPAAINAAGWRPVAALESDLRSEGDLHVVVGAVIEVNLVSNFSAKTNRPCESLNATAGVHGKISSAGVKPN